jgi:Ca-dependent carbohydrate-binding module xylan-binding
MLRHVARLALLLGVVTTASAAAPIKLDLADFKFAPDAKGTDELFKLDDGKLCFFANGSATVKLTVPADGEYTIVVDASCTDALKEKAKFTLKVGDTTVKENFELSTEDQKEYKFTAKLTKGQTTLSIRFTNDVYKENEYDRNLFVHGVWLEKK